MHEVKLHHNSVFLTLTLDDKKNKGMFPYPLSPQEFHRPFQLFMKRVRKAREVMTWDLGTNRRKVVSPQISYFMCGEYGELFQRPHWHAIVFGIDFPDMKIFKTNPFDLYRSAELERLWPAGHSSIGPVNKETAQYVAGYCVSRDDRPEHEKYSRLVGGQVVQVAPEYGRMSLRPAIGLRHMERFHNEVSVRDAAIVNGREFRPPKYYDRLLRGSMSYDRERGFYSPRDGLDPERFKEIKAARAAFSLELAKDSSPSRLRVAETVVKSRMALKRRLLE